MDRPKFCWDPTPGAQYTGTGPCLFTPMRGMDWRENMSMGASDFSLAFRWVNSNAAPFAWCTRNGGAG
ncbi:hypothetical protein FA13DRAFT_1735598, partial [Coprinellus micaceus]